MIERSGRTCYKSEDLITIKSSERFITSIIKSGHDSVLEHASASFRIVTNRFTTHQIVRHRLFSYSQESQRYCNYTKDKFDKEICFVRPIEIHPYEDDLEFYSWRLSCQLAEKSYFDMISNGSKPEVARSILPSSCKTELVMTGNFRNWRHFLKLRCDSHAQSDVRYLANEIKGILCCMAPTVFGDL
jgi:thymidylate synthase (FAD)